MPEAQTDPSMSWHRVFAAFSNALREDCDRNNDESGAALDRARTDLFRFVSDLENELRAFQLRTVELAEQVQQLEARCAHLRRLNPQRGRIRELARRALVRLRRTVLGE